MADGGEENFFRFIRDQEELKELTSLAGDYANILMHEDTRSLYNVTETEVGRRELTALSLEATRILHVVATGGDRTPWNTRDRWSVFLRLRKNFVDMMTDVFINCPDLIRLPRIEFSPSDGRLIVRDICSTCNRAGETSSYHLLRTSEAGGLTLEPMPSKYSRIGSKKADKRPNTPYRPVYHVKNEPKPTTVNPAAPNDDMSNHHIFPLGLLKAFYQMKSKVYAGMSEKERLINNVRRINQIRLTLPYTWRTSGEPYDKMSPNFKLSSSDVRELWLFEVKIFSWLPGNIFRGPRMRSDDMEDRFEENCRKIIGDERYVEMRDLYDNMKNFISTTYGPDSAIVGKKVSNQHELLQARLSRVLTHVITPWDPTKWELIDGKWRIKWNEEVANLSSRIRRDEFFESALFFSFQ